MREQRNDTHSVYFLHRQILQQSLLKTVQYGMNGAFENCGIVNKLKIWLRAAMAGKRPECSRAMKKIAMLGLPKTMKSGLSEQSNRLCVEVRNGCRGQQLVYLLYTGPSKG